MVIEYLKKNQNFNKLIITGKNEGEYCFSLHNVIVHNMLYTRFNYT